MKILLTIILSLGFCKAYGFQGSEGVITEPMDASSTPPPLPVRRELTWSMIDRLMTAESVLQSKDLELALEKYMEVTRETWDSSVAARTVQLATLLGDEDKIDKAIQLQGEADSSNIKASQTLVPYLIRAGNIDGAVDHLKLIIERISHSASPVAKSDPENIPLPDLEKKYHNPLQQKTPSFETLMGTGFNFAIKTLSKLLWGEHGETAINTMKQLVAEYEKENVESQMALAVLLSRAEQFDEALKAVESVVPFSTGNAQVTIFRAKLYKKNKEGQKALDVLAEFLKHHPNSKRIRIFYASTLTDMEQPEKAYDAFKELLRRYPDSDMFRYLFGLMLWHTDQLVEAKQQFEKLVDSDREPIVELANYSLGQIAESQKQYDEAIAFYRKVKHQKYHLNAQIRVAVVTAKKGELALARHYLFMLPKRNLQEVMAVYSAEANMLIDAGQYDEMTAISKRLLKLFPGNLGVFFTYVEIAKKAVDVNIIEEYINNILMFDPNNAQALNNLGYALVEYTDRYEEAYELIKRALQIDPAPYIMDSMGFVLLRMERYEEALEYLERASFLILPGVSGEIEAHIGEVYWALGQKEKAREIWNKALERRVGDEERLIETMERLDP